MLHAGKKGLPHKGLGRGLSALIPAAIQAPVRKEAYRSMQAAEGADGTSEEVKYVALKQILPNRYQPRTHWSDEKLKELADSIKQSGLLQPLLVRPRPPTERTPASPESFELIAGERRFRALQLAGFQEAPVIVRAVDGRTSLELAIVENIQREDLNPIDEAQGYRRLIQEFDYSQEELSKRVGRDRTTVTNSLRLLNLPTEIQKDLAAGTLTAGHARALLSLERDQDRLSLKKLIIAKGLSVRETERLVREAHERAAGKRQPQRTVSPEIRFIEEGLMAALGTKVLIKHRGRRGRIEIEYYSLDDLDRLTTAIRRAKSQDSPKD